MVSASLDMPPTGAQSADAWSEALLASLAASGGRAAVCLPACVALFNLTYRSPDAQRRARGAGASSVLRELLERHPQRRSGAHDDTAVLRDAIRRALSKVEAPEPTREERGGLLER